MMSIQIFVQTYSNKFRHTITRMMFSKNFLKCIVYFLISVPAYNVRHKMRIFGFFRLVFIVLFVPKFISWVLSVFQHNVHHVENNVFRKLIRKKGPTMVSELSKYTRCTISFYYELPN